MSIHQITTIETTRRCGRSGSSRIGNTEYSQDWDCLFDGPVTVTIWEDDEDGVRWEVWECPDCDGEHEDDLAPVVVEAPCWDAPEKDPWVDTKDHYSR